MFGWNRQDKIARIQAEEKLLEALEKLESVRNDIAQKTLTIEGLQKQLVDHYKLIGEHNELKSKLKEQAEAELLMSSMKIIKSILIDEKKVGDPYLASLSALQQQASNNRSL